MATPDSPPDKFLAVSHLTDAQQYRQAARILADSQFQQITSPQYFLISQSIELYLKAFNIAAGVKQSELKKVDTRQAISIRCSISTTNERSWNVAAKQRA